MPAPATKYLIHVDAETYRAFGEFIEGRTAPIVPCKCHADADLFAPEADADDAPRSFDEAMEEAIADQWADEAAELADMIADAVKPGDANYTLLLRLTRKLQAHIRRA